MCDEKSSSKNAGLGSRVAVCTADVCVCRRDRESSKKSQVFRINKEKAELRLDGFVQRIPKHNMNCIFFCTVRDRGTVGLRKFGQKQMAEICRAGKVYRWQRRRNNGSGWNCSSKEACS